MVAALTSRRVELPGGIVAEWHVDDIEMNTLNVDRTYQREPSQRLIDKIASDYNPLAAELLLVSDRGERPEEGDVRGGRFLINGQHRSLAALKRGETSMLARIVDFSHLERPVIVEAGLRLKTNVGLSDRPQERFKAQVAAEDPDSLAIQKILERLDTEINFVPNADVGINAVSTVEAIYNQDPSGALLYRTLEMMKQAFGGKIGGKSASATNMKAIAWFIESHDTEADWGFFLPRLSMMGTQQWYQQTIASKAALGGSAWFNAYRYLIELYNQGLSKKARLEFKTRGSATFASRSRVGGVGADQGAYGAIR